jgi:hypothetical protein
MSRRTAFLIGIAALLVVAWAITRPGTERNEGVSPDVRLELVLQDDALMLHGADAEVRRTAETLRRIGFDRVRLTAGWGAIAPEARPDFDTTDPGAYPPDRWLLLDRAVREADRAGLAVMIDVAFWAPPWAVERRDPGGRHRWRPDPVGLGRFARALARRYDGSFEHPGTGQPLPSVRLWTSWNEPNHSGFLLPQWENGRPASPHWYRAMHEAVYDALKDVDGDNRVLIGGLTSKGGGPPAPGRSITPLRFVRELACVDERLRPLARAECRAFRPLRADGFSHHPYSFTYGPRVPSPNPEWVAMADLDRLSGLLGALARRGRIERRLPLYLTEYGFETNPPDRERGVPPARQSDWLVDALAISRARRDVRMHAQFLLRDLRGAGYQTGLVFADGRPKPALAVFAP